MPRTKPTGIPASIVLAGGISRHGASCGCAYCAPDVVATQRQSIPIVRAAGVLQPPVSIPPTRRAIGEAFAAVHATIATLEAEREARNLIEPMTSIDWSPAQHVRAA